MNLLREANSKQQSKQPEIKRSLFRLFAVNCLLFAPQSMDDNTTRDRIRALVRDVLDKAIPNNDASGSSSTSSRFTTLRRLRLHHQL